MRCIARALVTSEGLQFFLKCCKGMELVDLIYPSKPAALIWEPRMRERERELNNVHAANKADGTARLCVFDV